MAASKRTSLVTDLVRQHVTGTLPALKRFDDVAGMAATLSEVEHIQESFSRKLDFIASDSRLTATGKEEARVAAGRKALAELEAWHAPLIDGLERHENQLRNELRAAISPKAPSTDVAERLEAAMLRSEIRRAASGLDKQQLENAYRQGDPILRQAFEEVPRLVTTKDGAVLTRPYISAEVKEKVFIEAAKLANPETAERIDDIHEVKSVYHSIATAFRREVQEAAPGAVERAGPRIVA